MRSIKAWHFLAIGLAVAVVAVTGFDLVARTLIRQQSFGDALREHIYYTTVVGSLVLAAPFLVLAWIAAATNRRAKTRSVATVFALGLGTLCYFYFDGFQGSQQALLDHHWTSSALSVGLLPFFIGIPVVIVSGILSAIVAAVDKRKPRPSP